MTYQPHQAEDVTLKTASDTDEWMKGYTMKGGTKVYCCYGMYADVGHDSGCRHSPRQVAHSSQASGAAGSPLRTDDGQMNGGNPHD